MENKQQKKQQAMKANIKLARELIEKGMKPFEVLSSVDMTHFIVEKEASKGKLLSYISWMDSWQMLKMIYPDAKREIVYFENKPYQELNVTVREQIKKITTKTITTASGEVSTEKVETVEGADTIKNIGFLVKTIISIGNESQSCELPVLSPTNDSLKSQAYQVTNKYNQTRAIAQIDSMDINTSIQRCFAKNCAMFGLGAYVYSGDDMPLIIDDDIEPPTLDVEKTPQPAKEDVAGLKAKLKARYEEVGHTIPAQWNERIETIINDENSTADAINSALTHINKVSQK